MKVPSMSATTKPRGNRGKRKKTKSTKFCGGKKKEGYTFTEGLLRRRRKASSPWLTTHPQKASRAP